MPILGLCSTETYSSDDYRFKNVRRSVQYFYPNGAAPLTGLLSLMDDEATNDPEFSHWEKRLSGQTTTTIANGLGYTGSGAGPFTTTVPGDLTASFTWTADTSYRVYVASAAEFRVNHMVDISCVISTITRELVGIVTAVNTSGNDYITVRATNTQATVPNAVTDISTQVLICGTAAPQGVIDLSTEVYNLPSKFTNYTQIHRTPFSMTSTALKTPLKYDETGPYKDKAKEHSIMHMIGLEKSIIFGQKHSYVPSGTVDPTTGTGLPVYTTGGILYYLRRWEAGDYGTVTASVDSDDDKRIIDNVTGEINEHTYNVWLERVFRVTNNTANEKLILCGSGALMVINEMYRSRTVLHAELPFTETYGMNVVKHMTPFGTVYYKTHPLFTQNAYLRYSMLILDVKNLRYRPMAGRDTELLKNRQQNDADYRKDEWLTEAGLEVWFPESHMFIRNVRSYVP